MSPNEAPEIVRLVYEQNARLGVCEFPRLLVLPGNLFVRFESDPEWEIRFCTLAESLMSIYKDEEQKEVLRTVSIDHHLVLRIAIFRSSITSHLADQT